MPTTRGLASSATRNPLASHAEAVKQRMHTRRSANAVCASTCVHTPLTCPSCTHTLSLGECMRARELCPTSPHQHMTSAHPSLCRLLTIMHTRTSASNTTSSAAAAAMCQGSQPMLDTAVNPSILSFNMHCHRPHMHMCSQCCRRSAAATGHLLATPHTRTAGCIHHLHTPTHAQPIVTHTQMLPAASSTPCLVHHTTTDHITPQRPAPPSAHSGLHQEPAAPEVRHAGAALDTHVLVLVLSCSRRSSSRHQLGTAAAVAAAQHAAAGAAAAAAPAA